MHIPGICIFFGSKEKFIPILCTVVGGKGGSLPPYKFNYRLKVSVEIVSKPLYEMIYQDLKRDIQNGTYVIGARIPSEKELAEKYQVSRITPKRSLEKLTEEGLVVRHVGRGSFVSGGELEGELFLPQESKGKIRTNNLVGVVITDFGDSYGKDILSGIEKSITGKGFMILKRTLGSTEKEKIVIQELVKLGVNGLIILPAQSEHFSPEVLKLIINNFPIVLIDRFLKGVPAVSFSSDNFSATKKGMEYLFQLGHKNTCILTSRPNDNTTIEERIEGFVQAHVENGVKIDKSLLLHTITSTLPNSFKKENIEKDVKKIKDHLKSNPKITALFAVEYNIALIAKIAVEQLNLKVPKDISIICFDSPSPSFGHFKFTHLFQEQEKMGEMAVEAILSLIQGDKMPAQARKIDVQLVIGESTANRLKNS